MSAQALAATHLAAFGPEKAWSEKTFAEFLADPSVLLCGDAQSFVLGRIVADEAEVLTVATAPAAQRAGLARAALRAFQDAARQAGAMSVFLEVAETNAAALALYSSLGFDVAGRRKGYYSQAGGDPLDALILRNDLTPR